MITIYSRSNHKIVRSDYTAGAPLPADALWIDLDRCTPAEVEQVGQFLHLRIPPLRPIHLLDQTRQFFATESFFQAIIPTIVGGQSGNPTSGAMMIILTPTLILTQRQAHSHALENFAKQLAHAPDLLDTPSGAFANIMTAVIARLADLTETVTHEMEDISRLVFSESLQRSKKPGQGNPDSWRRVLQGLGTTARRNHRILAALAGISHLLGFLGRTQGSLPEALSRDRLLSLEGEISHLTAQSETLVNEATFLLDAIVGAISIEQNNVIKIFSMVSVILMPPTMIASIYGMNFVHMPELAQPWAYPAVLILMLISAIVPWWWFKRSGWF